LISNSLTKDKNSNKEIANYLASIKDYNGALGTFSSNGKHEYTIPVALKTVRNNAFVPYAS
jgi:hypothetical protein